MMISVIIPCYNVAPYLAEAVGSVQAQTYPHWELILVDNNSTDGTRALMGQLAADAPDRITCLSESRQGVSFARNKGMTVARGAWLQFLDADDILRPEKLARQVSLLAASGATDTAALVVGSYYLQGPDGARTAYRAQPVADPLRSLAFRMLGQTSANLFRRAAVQAAGGWDEEMTHGGDCELVFRLLLRFGTSQVLWDRHMGSVYRKREGQLTEIFPVERYTSLLRMRAGQVDQLRRKAAGQPALQSYLLAYRDALYHTCSQLGIHDPRRATDLYHHYFGAGYRPAYRRKGGSSLLHVWARRGLSFRSYLKIRQMLKDVYLAVRRIPGTR